MEALAAKTLAIAAGEIGQKEDPPRSNRGPRVDQYIRAGHLDPAKGSYAWCACFGAWCITQAALDLGIQPLYRISARCEEVVIRNQALLLTRAEPGCIGIELKPDGDGHFVFVETMPDEQTIGTIEGNTDDAGGRTGGQVMRHVRPVTFCQAWLRIA